MHKKLPFQKVGFVVTEKLKIALAGNPNVGKSTVFNALTGLKQHTGNWTGKTVEVFTGEYKFNDKTYEIVDVPGTYSLIPHSKEESVARDFLCFSESDKILIVCDATALERNLYFVCQILELNKETVLCVNLLDEAKKKGIEIDLDLLSYELGVTVVGASARDNDGISEIKKALEKRNTKKIKNIKYQKEIEEALEYIFPYLFKMPIKDLDKRWLSLRLLDGDEDLFLSLNEYLGYDLRENEFIGSAIKKAMLFLNENGIDKEQLSELVAENLYNNATIISDQVTVSKTKTNISKDLKIDKFMTGKYSSYLVLGVILFLVFYITIVGANIPSTALMNFFTKAEAVIFSFFSDLGISEFFNNMLIKGGFRVLGWVVSVMLPPMAIFFPLFTILEDLGVLPRVTYVLDSKFQKANTCGKQALTICMGFGCNCVGVTGARIIDSKRERLIAILTNSFTPCNGRFPAIIKLISIFFISQVSAGSELLSALFLSVVIVFSIAVTLFVSNILSKTLLKGEKSHYILELPSYRKPQITKVITRSLLNRTIFVLGRAVAVAFPAGIIIWLLLNLGDKVILNSIISFFTPLGKLMGLDGEILTSFVLGIPANEIVLPICLMTYSENKELISIESAQAISEILAGNNWSIKTAICFIMFSVFHFPCATTLITIFKETKSFKWLLISFLLPTALGVIICMFFNFVFSFFEYVV